MQKISFIVYYEHKGDLPRTFQFFLSSYFLLFTYGSAY